MKRHVWCAIRMKSKIKFSEIQHTKIDRLTLLFRNEFPRRRSCTKQTYRQQYRGFSRCQSGSKSTMNVSLYFVDPCQQKHSCFIGFLKLDLNPPILDVPVVKYFENIKAVTKALAGYGKDNPEADLKSYDSRRVRLRFSNRRHHRARAGASRETRPDNWRCVYFEMLCKLTSYIATPSSEVFNRIVAAVLLFRSTGPESQKIIRLLKLPPSNRVAWNPERECIYLSHCLKKFFRGMVDESVDHTRFHEGKQALSMKNWLRASTSIRLHFCFAISCSRAWEIATWQQKLRKTVAQKEEQENWCDHERAQEISFYPELNSGVRYRRKRSRNKEPMCEYPCGL